MCGLVGYCSRNSLGLPNPSTCCRRLSSSLSFNFFIFFKKCELEWLHSPESAEKPIRPKFPPPPPRVPFPATPGRAWNARLGERTPLPLSSRCRRRRRGRAWAPAASGPPPGCPAPSSRSAEAGCTYGLGNCREPGTRVHTAEAAGAGSAAAHARGTHRTAAWRRAATGSCARVPLATQDLPSPPRGKICTAVQPALLAGAGRPPLPFAL